MGISGLLQFLKDASEPVHVRKYRGQTVAVDTYCWLHKGAFSCADKLAKGEHTEQYVWYCLKLVDMLLDFGVKPVLVFDGRNLPSKLEVEKSRRERRESNLQRGRELLRQGKVSEARDCFSRSINITPAMAHNLIKAARAKGVDCIVAPYEADAQLTFLTQSGLAQAVITEDSDLLAFGCRKVILKMDKQGNGLEIDQNHLGRCRSLGDVFTPDKFRHMCILSGCDYLASLHGVGLGRACKLLRLATEPDILKVIKKMGQYLKSNIEVPDQYIEGFVRANNTFLYQLVFDPTRRKVVPLNPYPEHLDPATLGYAGKPVEEATALQLALGNLDLNTMSRIDDFDPDRPGPQVRSRAAHWDHTQPPPHGRRSIWSRDFRPEAAAAAAAAAAEPVPSTRGQQQQQRALRPPCRELQVKRLREEYVPSEQEVLQQYAPPSPTPSRQKRPRTDPPRPDRTQSARNRFATLLQRRNQENQEDDAAATRSRFFSSPSLSQGPAQESPAQESPAQEGPDQEGPAPNESSPTDRTRSPSGNSDGPDVPSVETPSPPPPPGPARRGLFRWSGGSASSDERAQTPGSTSGLAALQRFQYKRETHTCSSPCGANPETPPPETTPPETTPPETTPPDSPPSQDSAYFSQSQSQEEETGSDGSTWSQQNRLTSEVTVQRDEEAELRPPPRADGGGGALGSKVSGLSKLRPAGPGPAAKVLGRARASGLSKRKVPSKENLPGVQTTSRVQTTIGSLWQNFSFKKRDQISSWKQGQTQSTSPDRDSVLISSF